MKAMSIVLAGLLMSGFAQAAQVTCDGAADVYKFSVQAAFDAQNRINGTIKLLISDGAEMNETIELNPTQGELKPSQSISMAGENDLGAGAIEATFDAAAGNYPGTLKASAAGTDVELDVVCTVAP